MKLLNGFKNAQQRVLFMWEWIQKLVSTFAKIRQARVSLFILVCRGFLLRPLSEAFPIQVGDQRETSSLPAGKHCGFWRDNDNGANLRLFKRKH